jgi:hypothetical protein
MYEIALAALEDLYEDIQSKSDRAIFQSRPASAVRIGQEAATVKAALYLIQNLVSHHPVPPQDGELLAR